MLVMYKRPSAFQKCIASRRGVIPVCYKASPIISRRSYCKLGCYLNSFMYVWTYELPQLYVKEITKYSLVIVDINKWPSISCSYQVQMCFTLLLILFGQLLIYRLEPFILKPCFFQVIKNCLNNKVPSWLSSRIHLILWL